MILVTGATGLTGHFVVEELLARGHAVRMLCRTEASAAAARARGVDVALGDLRDPDSLVMAARGTHGIVHAACTMTDSSVDVSAMGALLEGWKEGPFVFISSLDVYGLAGPGPIAEDAPLSETYGDYGRGKVACERLLAAAAVRMERSDYVMLRAPYIWGPHATAKKRLVVRRLLDHEPIILPGTDAEEWSRYQDAWVDVRDLATIVAACVSRAPGGPLNVLTGHYGWHDLYVELVRLTGSRSAIVHKALGEIADDELPNKHLYAQTWSFSEARLAQQLGTIPRLAFDVSLRDTVAAEGRA